MACSSSCRTQDHASWGDCVRSKHLTIEGVTAHAFNSKQRKDIDAYVAARKLGVQPKSTSGRDTETAMAISDRYGEAYVDGSIPTAVKNEYAA